MELLGKRFGDWIVIGEGNKPRTVYCECSCGFCNKEKRDVIKYNLIHGLSKGCGLKSKTLNGLKNRKQNKYIETDNCYEIQISDKKVLIDKEDYDKVCKYKWNLHSDSTNIYVRAYKRYKENGVKEYIFLHNLVMDNKEKLLVVDHIDGNTLNNKKSNLRLCTQKNNEINKKIQKNNKSGHKGVWYSSLERKWKAYITYNNKRIHLGTFINKNEAIKVREEAENKYFKNFNRGGLNE